MTARSARNTFCGALHPLKRIPWSELFIGVLFVVAGAHLWACSPHYPTVVKIKLATVPTGDSVSVLSEPVRENQSLHFTWTIETRFGGVKYLEWAAVALGRQGFTVRERQEHSWTLSKLDDGDAYRLNLKVTQDNPTRVQVTATLTPG